MLIPKLEAGAEVEKFGAEHLSVSMADAALLLLREVLMAAKLGLLMQREYKEKLHHIIEDIVLLLQLLG